MDQQWKLDKTRTVTLYRDRIRGFETFSANCVNIEILSLRLIDLRESSKRFRDLFRNLILSKFFFFFFLHNFDRI